MRKGIMLWEPAIYEHKAALIDHTVSEVARDADLLADAVIKEHAVYQADYLTVGIDVYNIEAEACGSKVVEGAPDECPEIRDHQWDLHNLPEHMKTPDMSRAGRCSMMLEAGRKVENAIGGDSHVRMAASGPVSIAAKLVGLEPLVMALAMDDAEATRLLEFTTDLSIAWCRAIRESGLETIIFDSAASPPMISPQMYADHVRPLHTKIMKYLAQSEQGNRPLITGGDTTSILPDVIDAGATMLICDYNCDAGDFADALPPSSSVRIRRNVDPSMFSEPGADLEAAATQLTTDLSQFDAPIAGTGILPYDAQPELFWKFRRAVESSHFPACQGGREV